jgi:hypothetical protein
MTYFNMLIIRDIYTHRVLYIQKNRKARYLQSHALTVVPEMVTPQNNAHAHKKIKLLANQLVFALWVVIKFTHCMSFAKRTLITATLQKEDVEPTIITLQVIAKL